MDYVQILFCLANISDERLGARRLIINLSLTGLIPGMSVCLDEPQSNIWNRS
jgi:hypothetical protein